MGAFALQCVEDFFDAVSHGASRIFSSVGNSANRHNSGMATLKCCPVTGNSYSVASRLFLVCFSFVSRLWKSAWISGLVQSILAVSRHFYYQKRRHSLVWEIGRFAGKPHFCFKYL
jgi:hypothetical protein